MTWKMYRLIVNSSRYNNAVTGGGDNSTDPNPARDPNNYLAPIAQSNTTKIILILLAIYLGILIFKNLRQ